MLKGGKKLRLCKFGQWCDRGPKSCFFIHSGDPEYEEALRRDPNFVAIRSTRQSPEIPMQRSPDRGWASRRPTRDRSRSRSRDRSPRRDDHRERRDDRRDDYRDRRDRPRGRSVSRDRTPSPPPPPRSRIPASSSRPLSPPRQSQRPGGNDSRGGASSSSRGAAKGDKEPGLSHSRRTSTSTSMPVTSTSASMPPRSSNQSPSSIPPTDAPKADLDSAFKRSGLGQKKADNPFKSPAAPPATNASSTPNSTATRHLINGDGLRQIASRASPQRLSWKPIGGNPSPSDPSTSGNADMQSASQGKGKGKEKEVLSTSMEVEVVPEVATKSGTTESARTTKDEWLKKIWLLVAAVETRARHLDIKTELHNLKRLQDRYPVKGEHNSESRKRLVEELDKKVATEKAAVAKLKELCFQLASGAPGDDNPEFQPPASERGDTKYDIKAAEERKILLASLKQVQEDVHQVTAAVSETSKILAQHRNNAAALNGQPDAHDADGDVHMDTAQPIAGPSSSSSVQASQANDRSLLKEITKLKRRIDLLDQGLEDARAEVEDARVTLVAKIDSLAEAQAVTTPEGTNQDQTPESPQQATPPTDVLVQRVDQLSEEVAFVANIVADATEKTTEMSLKSLRDQNVDLRERLGMVGDIVGWWSVLPSDTLRRIQQLEQDRARRNGIIDQLAKRLAQVQRPPLPTEELRNEVVERTRSALRPILEDLENKNEEAVKKAEIRLTRQLRDSLEDVGILFSRLKNLPVDRGAGVSDLQDHSPRSSMTDSSMH